MTTFSTTISTLALSLLLGHIAVGGLPVDTAASGAPRLPSFSLAAFLPSYSAPPPAQKAANPPPQPRPIRKRPLLAAAEVAGINLGVWAFLHYVGGAFYSYISWETIRDNFRDGFEWDRSRYFVNFYHHPYHGYLYFSAGRANGLNYWGSALATLGGSLMWEVVMEKYRPSINDLVTTTAGGCVYGEIGYRFSALVRKKDARGLGRIWREAVGTILDPIGGVNRLLNGRKDSDPGLPGSPDAGRILNGEVVLTGPVVTRSAELAGTRAAPLVGFTLNYGDPAGRAGPDIPSTFSRSRAGSAGDPTGPTCPSSSTARFSEKSSPPAAAPPTSSGSTSTTNTTGSTRCASAARRSPAAGARDSSSPPTSP